MIIIKRDNPQIFGGKAFLMSDDESLAINTIAEAISVNRGPLVQLLRQHDIEVNDNASKNELLGHLSQAFNNQNFALDFAKQYSKKYEKKYSNYDDEEESSSMIKSDSENSDFWSGTYSSGSNSNSDSNSGSNSAGNSMGGGGYLGLINGIIGGVGGILGLFSKPDTTGQQLNYNQQILALAAEKEAQKKRNQTIAIIAVIIFVLGVAGFTFYYAKKNKAI